MANPQTSFHQTAFTAHSFIARKQDIVFNNTLPYQLQVLKDTGRYDAFKLEWNPIYDQPPNVWPVPNHLFWDSDVAKWIEGACYLLRERKEPQIEAAINELVEMIQSAQQPDGYLNIHFTVVEPKQRWSNLRDLHELYNAGHLIEAAVAHEQLYQNGKLLRPIVKYVDLISDVFGPGENQRHGYPGHPEIELALLRLYQLTKNPKHRALAKYFLDERGNPTGQDGRHYYDVEAENRGERPFERPLYYPKPRSYWYQQAHSPILEQQTIEGHSVRAMYLLTAVADLIRLDTGGCSHVYVDALHRLWSNLVDKKMYLTGGIGAMEQWEGFGIDYFLPQGTDEGGCYAETCAAIGVMMLAERLLQIDLDGRYADIMELCFYNAVLTGMSSDGKAFTYDNQLATTDSHLSKREEWFTCACCPPNVTRLLASIGGYLWSSHANEDRAEVSINVHMYASASFSVPVNDASVRLSQESNWPWDGTVKFSSDVPKGMKLTIKLRIPGYASEWNLSPPSSSATVVNGYLTLDAQYLDQNPAFHLTVPLKPRFLSPHPYTNQQVVALARGPIVYCVEDVDNDWVRDHFKSLVFNPPRGEESISESQVTDSATKEPYIRLTAHDSVSFLGEKDFAVNGLGRSVDEHVRELDFIPYYFRANRGGRGHMRVGLRKLKC